MYYYYVLKIYFVDGDYAYYFGHNDDGSIRITKELNCCCYYDTYDEAANVYKREIRGINCMANGIRVDEGKCTVVRIQSNYPLGLN